jgi:hypothetical protein
VPAYCGTPGGEALSVIFGQQMSALHLASHLRTALCYHQIYYEWIHRSSLFGCRSWRCQGFHAAPVQRLYPLGVGIVAAAGKRGRDHALNQGRRALAHQALQFDKFFHPFG